VLIECRLLETILNPSTSKGIDWSGTLKAQNVTFGNGVTVGHTDQSSGQNSSLNSSLNSGLNSSQNAAQNAAHSSGNTSTTTSPGAPVTTTTTWPGGATTTSTASPDSDHSSTAFSSGSSSGSSSSSSAGSSALSSLAGSGLNSAASTVLSSLLGNGGLSLDTAKGFNPATFFLNADGVRAVLSFLNTYTETRVISTPRTVTLDNEMALIDVGVMFPIVNTTAGTANTTGGSSVSYSNLTVSLRVTPRISANNYVKLQINPTVVRLGDLVPSVVGGVNNAVYAFQTRQIQTSVLVPSGNTLVMGGLIQDELHKGNIKVPILGDIPYIGLLFRSDTKSRTKSNMIVFLTPTIVEDEDFQPTQSTYLKTKAPVRDTIERDWSAWDSGKPMEWSRPSTDKIPDGF
jgi:type II secretory pathway component GspD/PulD (secretin)